MQPLTGVCLDVLEVDYNYYGDAVFFYFFVLLWSCGGSTLSVTSLVGCRVYITTSPWVGP
jgi:hypothetical protein